MTHADPLEPLRRELNAHLKTTGSPTAATPACLDDHTATALAEGTLGAVARTVAVAHLAECSRCRGAVAAIARALADPAVAREVAAAEGVGRGRFLRIGLPAAAAAVLLVLAWPKVADEGRSPHRERAITAVAAPLPLAPIGAVADARVLRWSSVAGADRYRATLFDGTRVLYETQLADTLAPLPDTVVLVPGRLYLWKVEARTGWDRWSASELVQFRVARGTSP